MTDAPFCAAPEWNKDRLLAQLLKSHGGSGLLGFFFWLFNVIRTKHKPLGFSLCLTICTNMRNENLFSPFPSSGAVMTRLSQPLQVWALQQPQTKKEKKKKGEILKVQQGWQGLWHTNSEGEHVGFPAALLRICSVCMQGSSRSAKQDRIEFLLQAALGRAHASTV